jgi:molecular chaperone DnaK
MLVADTILQSRYRVLRQLGQGGMGTVYEALDERLGTTVAVKEAHYHDEHLRKQFEREARLLARLRHPTMTRVIDHFQDAHGQFLVMDFIPGEDLLELLRRSGGVLSTSEVLSWADQLLDALEYLHSQEPPVVHRDIKPQNLKLAVRNQIILLDFGLAKGFAGYITGVAATGSVFGYTPNYAPLEQIQGTGTDPRSDLYSLAATLYHLLTNTIPPNVLDRLMATTEGQPDPLMPANKVNREVTTDLAAMLNRALAIGRNQRFTSATEMRAALQTAIATGSNKGGVAKIDSLPPTVLTNVTKTSPTANDSGSISIEMPPGSPAPVRSAELKEETIFKKISEETIESNLPKSSTIIGIDFGTSNSVVSVWKRNEPIVIPNSENGLRQIPSVVAFKKDGARIVGQAAKGEAVTNPQNTISSILRFMGRRFDEVGEQTKYAPFKVHSAEDGAVTLRVGRKDYAPPEIAAIILQELKKSAEKYLSQKIDKAVIAIPAYFNEGQRQAIKDAGKIAGLEVMRLIHAPSAAAFAYNLEIGSKKEETIAVFDLGGGTFSFSIIDVGLGVVDVRATCGDTRLGGDDIDDRLIEWIIEKSKKDHNIDLFKGKMPLQRLKEAAEKAKIELSSAMETEINVGFITADQSGPKHPVIKLTRREFEQLIDPILQRLAKWVEQAIDDAGLNTSKIDQIMLVGGSTSIPKVQSVIKGIFRKEPNRLVNPKESVAVGAAIQAGVLSGEYSGSLLLDVMTLSLGIETLGGVFTKLIERNTSIPTRKSEIFSTATDNQKSVEVHVLQGERPMAVDNRTLGKFHLVGIPPAPRGMPQIDVTFDIDANGIVNVSAKDMGTGREQKVTIKASGRYQNERDRPKDGAGAPTGDTSLAISAK